MDFKRLGVIHRIPLRIQLARIVARRKRKILHLIRHAGRRGSRLDAETRALDFHRIAARRHGNISSQRIDSRQQRRDCRVFVARRQFTGLLRHVRRREFGLRGGDERAERRQRGRRRWKRRVARERRLDVRAFLDDSEVGQSFEVQFDLSHTFFGCGENKSSYNAPLSYINPGAS